MHLTCVFSLIVEEEFGTCLRVELLAPLESAGGELTLDGIKSEHHTFKTVCP